MKWVPGKGVPCFQTTSLRMGILVTNWNIQLSKVQGIKTCERWIFENLLPIVEQGVSGCSFLVSHLSNGLPDNRIVNQQQKVKVRLQNRIMCYVCLQPCHLVINRLKNWLLSCSSVANFPERSKLKSAEASTKICQVYPGEQTAPEISNLNLSQVPCTI